MREKMKNKKVKKKNIERDLLKLPACLHAVLHEPVFRSQVRIFYFQKSTENQKCLFSAKSSQFYLFSEKIVSFDRQVIVSNFNQIDFSSFKSSWFQIKLCDLNYILV
jgi:hypothetical protein